MKVGDVVRRGKQLGIVTRVDPDVYVIHFLWMTSMCGSGLTEELVTLTPEQRSIVNTAIAAEALRRMG